MDGYLLPTIRNQSPFQTWLGPGASSYLPQMLMISDVFC
jgi:hypothetical protein